MGHLTEQERTVVSYRFGLAGGPPLTLKEIGEKMGISRERVRQIECQAKTRLRKMFARKRMVAAPSKRPYPVSAITKPARTES
jgi:DNA-directed RNA polymerase sigma subunit (sigma70/sigma32)